MKYLVIEIQKYADDSIGIPPIATYDSFQEAASRYHTILASAAISNIPLHSALILNEAGQKIKLDNYQHDVIEEQTQGEE